jgi:RND family efflux transporter MFP subunit
MWLLVSLLPVSGVVLAQEQFALDNREIRAQLVPSRQTQLSAEIGAVIKSISVHEGDRFKQHQALITFDCALQEAQMGKAKAQLAGAENIHRGNQHLSTLDAIGQVELQSSKIEVRKAKADIVYLDVSLKKCQINAPFPGRAGELQAQEQQYVRMGQPLLDIFDDSVFDLEFIVPSRWLTWFELGYKFNVYIDETDKTYPVTLSRLSGRADPVSQSIKAIAVVEGEYPELIAGMSGRIMIPPRE